MTTPAFGGDATSGTVSGALDAERRARVAWSRLVEPADEDAYQLLTTDGYVDGLARIRQGSSSVGRAAEARLATFDLDRELRATDAAGARILFPGDPEWPVGLDDVTMPPHCIWVRGDVDLSQVTERSASVVGARAATPYGEHVATELGYGLAEKGFTIISGAAFGIDAAAHRGALAADGVTVAALACGIDRVYPAAHRALFEEILEFGALVSEVPPGSAPLRHRFLARNRIIAALSPGTVVVEAGLRSGSLNTARWAADCGRLVAAFPGPVTSAASAGTHDWIRSHQAELVTDAAEVAELFGDLGDDLAPHQRGPERPEDRLRPRERLVWEALPQHQSVPSTNVARTAGVSQTEVMRALGRLELAGLAQRGGRGWLRAEPGSDRARGVGDVPK